MKVIMPKPWLFDWDLGPEWWRKFAWWWFVHVWVPWISSEEEYKRVLEGLETIKWLREVNR